MSVAGLRGTMEGSSTVVAVSQEVGAAATADP